DLHLESGRSMMEQILAEDGVDCVYVTNNRMSAGAFEAMRGRADAPALLATDDDLWTRLVTPSVSVVRHAVGATDRAAARTLGQRMRHPEEEPSTTLLRPRIVERESTRPRGSCPPVRRREGAPLGPVTPAGPGIGSGHERTHSTHRLPGRL